MESDSSHQAMSDVGHERLLEAVAFSAKELLSAEKWENSINGILRILGEASTSSRVYVFRHEVSDEVCRYTCLAYEWCAFGIEPQIETPELQRIEIEAVGFKRWINLLNNGHAVYGCVEDFPEDEQPLLQQQDIKSLVVLPFFVSGKWWGFIGFDQCDAKRNWTTAEIAVLQAAASMIGSAIEREFDKNLLEIQNEELRKINHELDSFVYSVSHDLRAPLVTILGLLNIAEKEPLSPNLTLYLQHIRNSIFKLDNFVKEILEYSHNTRTDTQLETINIKQLLEEISSTIVFTDSSVEVILNIAVKDYILVFDRKRLLVILTNLLHNAFKFRDINKLHRYIKIDVEYKSEKLLICIEDNGIGIEKDHLPKIFDMFYRASEKNHGSGLGLYITKEIVKKLNGEIQIESEIEKFTRINVTFPIVDKI